MATRKRFSRIRYFLGLILILGALGAFVLQFRASRILSYDMLPPDMSGPAPAGNSH